MNELYKWRKIKKKDIKAAQQLLVNVENEYVSACAKFIMREKFNDPIWALSAKNKEIAALIINSRSTILPVLCGVKEIPNTVFLKGLMRSKIIHSIQGLKDEVRFTEREMEKNGKLPDDIIDYDLMSLDKLPEGVKNSGPSNLILRLPRIDDIDEMTPLQAAYEKEEVLPKGSAFNPAASKASITNLITSGKILAAEINGRLVGKINVNAVSFSRYQVGGVYVHPDYRGKGVAKRMAAEFITSLTGEGKGVTLFVKKNNNAAKQLYGALGFIKINDYRITYY